MRPLALAISLVVLTACGQVKSAFDGAQKSESAISDAVGGGPKVGFGITNGHLRVSVHFTQMPSKDLTLSEMRRTVEPLVAASFEKKVDALTISF